MIKAEKDGPEKIVYKGRILEIVNQPMKVGDKKMTFERARRSPGVRLIIIRDGKMLLTKEYREEIEKHDYRLPGGKAFDSLDEYNKHLSEDILPYAVEAAKREAKEEAGIIANNITHFITAHAGTTVVWDLIYFIVDDFEESESGQELDGAGEVIEVEWKTFDEVKELCANGDMNEYRSVGVLFKFFLEQDKA